MIIQSFIHLMLDRLRKIVFSLSYLDTVDKLSLYETNLEGHWDAMNPSSMIKDDQEKVMTWFDETKKYDVNSDRHFICDRNGHNDNAFFEKTMRQNG